MLCIESINNCKLSISQQTRIQSVNTFSTVKHSKNGLYKRIERDVVKLEKKTL